MTMSITVKICSRGDIRKFAEIPKSMRDNFEIGEEVLITKVKHDKKD